MASCITSQWVSTAPQLMLTVAIDSSTDSSVRLYWLLQYVASYPASASARPYSAIVNGSEVASGTFAINGKTGTHDIDSGFVTVSKGTSAKTVSFSCSMEFNLTWSGVYGGTKSASGSISVPAKVSYTVAYNANGGSGAPSSQTKTQGATLALSSTKPTRTGYSFLGWAESSSATSAQYSSGGSYSKDQSVTLYAVWKANTYTVAYDANGGSGAPSNQTKTHGKELTLSSTKPTRANHTFLGWGTSKSSTTVAYSAGNKYTANADITLYAIWKLTYLVPRITNYEVDRCDSSGNVSEDATCAKVMFDWECDKAVSSIAIEWRLSKASEFTNRSTVSASGTSGSVSTIIGSSALSADSTYIVQVTVTDASGSSSERRVLNGVSFPIDVLKGGTGVAFGKPAERSGVDFGMHAYLRNSMTLYGETIDGTWCNMLGVNSSNTFHFGYGGYNNSIGTTYYNGNEVRIRSKSGVYVDNKRVLGSEQDDNKYWGILTPEGSDSNWIRTTQNGLIPYSQGGASGIGSPSWPFNYGYFNHLHINGRELGTQKILWSGAYYVQASQTVNLSEPVSAQPNGIVVAFSVYDGGAVNWGWNLYFVPKQFVALHPGAQTTFFGVSLPNCNYAHAKTLSIYDDYITGNDGNKGSGTMSGITYDNSKHVLRYVLGV